MPPRRWVARCSTWRSAWFSRLFWLREEQQAMSVALFATADRARAAFYDATADLDDAYRALIQSQSIMTENTRRRATWCCALPRGRAWATASA